MTSRVHRCSVSVEECLELSGVHIHIIAYRGNWLIFINHTSSSWRGPMMYNPRYMGTCEPFYSDSWESIWGDQLPSLCAAVSAKLGLIMMGSNMRQIRITASVHHHFFDILVKLPCHPPCPRETNLVRCVRFLIRARFGDRLSNFWNVLLNNITLSITIIVLCGTDITMWNILHI